MEKVDGRDESDGLYLSHLNFILMILIIYMAIRELYYNIEETAKIRRHL